MNRMMILVLGVLVLAACQKQENAPQATTGISSDRQEMAKKLIIKSLSDLQNRDLKSAVSSLEASIKVNPTSSDAYLLLGQILLKVQEYEHAADFLDDSAKLFPNNGMIFYMLSIANRMQGKKLPAVLAARRAVELFQEAQDKDNMLKSAVLLQDLINTPDDQLKQAMPTEAPVAKPAKGK